MKRRAFPGLGSNRGRAPDVVATAIAAIPDLARVSSLYETDPIGGPEQGAFLNCVVELDFATTARELLELCRPLEAAAERVRIERWKPRILDSDVIHLDGDVVDKPDLTVPHPRWREQ